MTSAPQPSSKPAKQREWMGQFWLGCNMPAWLRLATKNYCAVNPLFIPAALITTGVSMGHSVLQFIQESLYGSRLDRTPIAHPPLFIIGHWRTGTTLLHELLALDPRHNFPSTSACLEPNHFLLTDSLTRTIFGWLLPRERPMDAMKVDWNKPQEDEFALCLMGAPSPYLTIAFPNNAPKDQAALDLDGLKPPDLALWKRKFVGFLKRLTYRDPRRLVLKSPTHSCRIPTLLELFPDAQFVHIVRNPYVVFPSTVNLWKSLYDVQGLQFPTYRGLEEHVFSTHTHLYERIEQGKKLIPTGNFHELRYEDLVARPVEELQKMYQALGMDGFDRYRPRLEDYLKANADYKTNRWPPMSDELKAEITRRWAVMIDRYGYLPPE
jgi:omega-hydroxy-beta-dihydromenaquinone-9 sulfotransferase